MLRRSLILTGGTAALILLGFVCADASAQTMSGDEKAQGSKAKAGRGDKVEQPWGARVLPHSDGPTISGLRLSEVHLPVSMLRRQKKIRPYVKLQGSFRNPEWKLFVVAGDREEGVELDQKGNFEVFALLRSQMSHVDFIARSSAEEGEEQKQRIKVYSPQAQEFRIGDYLGEFWIGAGGGAFQYFQTGFGDFVSKNVVQKLSYRSPVWWQRWGLRSSFKSPVWTVSSAPIDASPDMLNAELDITYVGVSSQNRPYKAFFSLGMSYFTLLSYGAPFGFKNLFVPAVGFEYHKRRNRYDSYVFSGRYMPIGGVLSSEFGFELRVGYRMKLINLHNLQLDASWFRMSYVPMANAEIRTRLFALVGTYQF